MGIAADSNTAQTELWVFLPKSLVSPRPRLPRISERPLHSYPGSDPHLAVILNSSPPLTPHTQPVRKGLSRPPLKVTTRQHHRGRPAAPHPWVGRSLLSDLPAPRPPLHPAFHTWGTLLQHETAAVTPLISVSLRISSDVLSTVHKAFVMTWPRRRLPDLMPSSTPSF